MAGSQSDRAEQRLNDLGIELPAPPQPFGAYVGRCSPVDCFLSGMLPVVDHKPKYLGRIGQELDTESGRDATLRTASMSALSAARAHLGTRDKVTRVVRLGIYLATFGDFVDQPKVADAASELFESIFGRDKTLVRMLLGRRELTVGHASQARSDP